MDITELLQAFLSNENNTQQFAQQFAQQLIALKEASCQ